LIVATILIPSLLRSRQAAVETSAALAVQNVPEVPYTETQPVRQSPARLKSQPAPVDSGVAPQIAQNERAQESQNKLDSRDQDKEEELRSDFAKDARSEADSIRVDEFRGGVGGALQRAAEPAAPPAIARAITPIGAPAPALADRRSRPSFNTEAYDRITDNPFIRVSQDPLATFSIDVDTASYANVRRFINQNQQPPKDAVRIEEMINYFTYDYPQPTGPHPILAQMEVASAPWSPQHRLVRIGIKGKDLNLNRRPSSNLVFLIDVSGSMQPPEKLPLLKTAMKMMVENLTENDRVSIVVYAGASGTVLPPTRGDRKDVILRALDNLEAGGSTNGALGIQLAYSLAAENYIPRGTNRVILATDGDFNVGVTNQGDLIRLIEEKAKGGVFLSVLGFGLGNLKDSTLEKLADSGNGNYAYIDTLNEARKVLVEQMGGTLVTIAKDVKIQIEFNPAQVNAYRLIGYENRVLRNEDFNNDLKDAGDMGAGHTVTALFEVVPAGVDIAVPGVDPLKYQTPPATVRSSSTRETLTLKIRYKDPEGSESKLLEVPLVDSGKSFVSATTDFRFAASVAAFGMILRDSPYKGNASIGTVLDMAEGSRGQDRNGYRGEFIGLVNRARSLGR
jgi:Ca-activated chloride channel homolog